MFSYAIFKELLDEKRSEVRDVHTFGCGVDKCINSEHCSPGCRSCQSGTNVMVFVTQRCNLNCQCCPEVRPNYQLSLAQPESKEEVYLIESHISDSLEIFEPTLALIKDKVTSISYTGGEPLLVVDKIEGLSAVAKRQLGDPYQWMYTNGLLATEEKLSRLNKIGINEIRFDWAATDFNENMVDTIRLMKKYIPKITIEIPMYRKSLIEAKFLPQLGEAIDAGASCINCIELVVNRLNKGRLGLTDDELYVHPEGTWLSPYWSRLITYDIMKYVQDNNLDICVNDCSNDTRWMLNLQRKLNGILLK